MANRSYHKQTNKSARLAGEIQREVAEIIASEVKDPRVGFVSVLSVEAAPDGSSCRIHISSLDSQPADLAAALESAKGFIRKKLGQRLKARLVPELHFVLDSSTEYAIRMAQVIDRQLAEDREKHKEETDAE